MSRLPGMSAGCSTQTSRVSGGVRGSWIAYLALATALALAAPASSAQALDPLMAKAERVRAEIFDVAQWGLRVPYKLAFPLVARARLKSFLAELPLEDEVRARVEARIEARAFVDEFIPFLMTVKDMYSARFGEAAARNFDAHLRRTYRPDEPIPGMEHSMFKWQPETEQSPEAEVGFGLDPEIAAELVRFYDALYLRETTPDAGLDEQLGCARERSAASRALSLMHTAPIVRRLLEQFAVRLELDPEMGAAIRVIAEDARQLETVTLSLIQFIDQIVCKHYRIFATRVYREEQLRNWMLQELDRPDGGRLFDWLEHANRRRHGVLIVVDGLQGHLMEALAGGREAAPFITRIRDEQRAGAARVSVPHLRPAPGQQTRFLEALTNTGWKDSRYLPFFRDLYQHAGPNDPLTPVGVARVGISTTPTISVRNLPIAWTGAPVAGPGSTGVPNFHFVDRTYVSNGVLVGRPYYFYGNDALQLGRLTREAGMRSLFDRLPTYASMGCAVQYDDAAHYSIDAFLNLGLGEKLRDFAEVLCVSELERRAQNEVELRKLRDALLQERDKLTRKLAWYRFYSRSGQRDMRALARRSIARIAALETETLPELLVYYIPWPDHFAHFTGPFADEIIAPSGELARLDYWLGRIRDAYAAGGAADRVLFGVAGDHGLTPAFQLLNPEVEVFDALRAEGIDFRVRKISSDEGEGPKLNHPIDPPSMKGIDVVVASTAGGNYMIDLFEDQGLGWAEQPLRADLVALSPLMSRGDPAAPRVDIVEEIYSRLCATLDYLVVREKPSGVDGGQAHLIGARKGQRADAWITRRHTRIYYRYTGSDLLGTDRLSPYRVMAPADRAVHSALRQRCVETAREADPATWCDETTWRELTSYTARPDSVVQLAHLYDHPRAGTINLFPRAGIGYNSFVPGRHAGETFHEKDAFVGLFGAPLAGPRGRPRLRTAVIGSVPMAIYEYLTATAATQGENGWGYPSLHSILFDP